MAFRKNANSKHFHIGFTCKRLKTSSTGTHQTCIYYLINTCIIFAKKCNLNCFRLRRTDLQFSTAKPSIHATVISHSSYCIAQASQSTINPSTSPYNQAIKIMNKKPMRWQHSLIFEKKATCSAS